MWHFEASFQTLLPTNNRAENLKTNLEEDKEGQKKHFKHNLLTVARGITSASPLPIQHHRVHFYNNPSIYPLAITTYT